MIRVFYPWGENELVGNLTEMRQTTVWAEANGHTRPEGPIIDADGRQFCHEVHWRFKLWDELQAPPHNKSEEDAANAVNLPVDLLRRGV